jgi:hypothetical protein
MNSLRETQREKRMREYSELTGVVLAKIIVVTLAMVAANKFGHDAVVIALLALILGKGVRNNEQ